MKEPTKNAAMMKSGKSKGFTNESSLVLIESCYFLSIIYLLFWVVLSYVYCIKLLKVFIFYYRSQDYSYYFCSVTTICAVYFKFIDDVNEVFFYNNGLVDSWDFWGTTVEKLVFKSDECYFDFCYYGIAVFLTSETLIAIISFLINFLSTFVILESFLANISSVAMA